MMLRFHAPTTLLLSGALVVVIDRIEADHAVLEWREGVFTPLPLVVLPKDLIEGEHLQVQWQRVPRPPPPVLPPQSELPDFSEIPHPAESPQPPPSRIHAPQEPPC
jgi:hypothetical protein